MFMYGAENIKHIETVEIPAKLRNLKGMSLSSVMALSNVSMFPEDKVLMCFLPSFKARRLIPW